MSRKLNALLMLAAPLLLWTTYLVMAGLRPDFSYKYKAISELGAVGAPHGIFWNVLGYLLPGCMIAAAALGLHRQHFGRDARKLPMLGLVFSGLLMALAGVFPADMEQRESLTSLLHSVGSFGSYVAFLVAAFSYFKLWRNTPGWRPLILPASITVGVSLLFGAWPMVFPHMPAVGQRVVFLCYSLWVKGYAGWSLLRRGGEN